MVRVCNLKNIETFRLNSPNILQAMRQYTHQKSITRYVYPSITGVFILLVALYDDIQGVLIPYSHCYGADIY